MAKSERSHGEGDNNRNLIPTTHGRSPTHSRLQRALASALTSFMLSPVLSSIAVSFSILPCDVQLPSLMTSLLLNAFISPILLFLQSPFLPPLSLTRNLPMDIQ